MDLATVRSEREDEWAPEESACQGLSDGSTLDYPAVIKSNMHMSLKETRKRCTRRIRAASSSVWVRDNCYKAGYQRILFRAARNGYMGGALKKSELMSRTGRWLPEPCLYKRISEPHNLGNCSDTRLVRISRYHDTLGVFWDQSKEFPSLTIRLGMIFRAVWASLMRFAAR